MKMHIDYKIKNGKLIRIDAQIEGELIKSFRLTGDFFIYPESAISDIERIVLNTKMNEVNAVLSRFLEENNIKLIGFDAVDIVAALKSIQN